MIPRLCREYPHLWLGSSAFLASLVHDQQPRVCSAIAVHHVALRRSEGDASLRLQSCRNTTSFPVGVALVTLLTLLI